MAERYEAVSTIAKLSKGIQFGYAALVFVFMFLPIAVMVMFSFNANRYGTFPITGWTLEWYQAVFQDTEIKAALMTSLRVSAQVTVVAVVVGTAAAFPLSRARLRHRSWIRLGYTLPLMIPGLIIGVSLLILFTQVFHVQLSPETAMVGQAVYTTPFVVLIVTAQLDSMDPMLERAASDLGATRLRVFRHILLPLLSTAIISGALFAFALSLDEFIITMFLIGYDNTLPIYIYSQVRFGITPEVNALASLLLLAAVVLILFGVLLPLVLRRLQSRWAIVVARPGPSGSHESTAETPREGSVPR
jgi:ABC-type spermidine/putrescine transport system permease subunit II